ncbi:MAG: DUF222 domain-containing protein [Acidimicrobiia bacterium]
MGALKSTIDEWATEPIEELSDEVLGDQLVELEGAISGLEAERSRRLHLFNKREAHNSFGMPSSTAFLIHRCRIAPHRAARLVAMAKSLARMPRTSRSWKEDQLGQDQVRILAHAHDTNPEIFEAKEDVLVDTVEPLSVVDTSKAVTYWRQLVNARRFDEDWHQLHERRRVHLSQTFEGLWRLSGWFDPEAGGLIKTALDAATPPPADGDTRTPVQRRADGLADLARLALDSGTMPEQGGEKPHLFVLVDPHGVGETSDGTVLAASDSERLGCDASVTRIVMGPNSEILDVGRKTRVVPPSLRRAVIARDRHCQHPDGCLRSAKWCDIDHRIPWQDGGETKLENLQLLCRYHHTLKHSRGRRQVRETHPARSVRSVDRVRAKSP